MGILNEALPAAEQLHDQFVHAHPYAHVIIDSFLSPATAQSIVENFPDPHHGFWTQYRHLNSKKLGSSDFSKFPPALQKLVVELQSPEFLAWLSQATGIPRLIADPELEGGGMHLIERGGFLNVHTDFSAHYRHPNWKRQINLIVYFNPEWRPEWQGSLELWDAQMQACQSKILPLFNRAVIFKTDAHSFHGHPDPLSCPEKTYRKSMAFYYFTDEKQPVAAHSTFFTPRPGDRMIKRLLAIGDRELIRLYGFLRRSFKFSNHFVSRILNFFKSKN